MNSNLRTFSIVMVVVWQAALIWIYALIPKLWIEIISSSPFVAKTGICLFVISATVCHITHTIIVYRTIRESGQSYLNISKGW